MLSNIAKRRLSHLADVLEQVPPAKFDIWDWHRKTDCGTVGCAFGWAATDPKFRKAGLRLEKSSMSSDRSFPAFKGARGFSAAELFFRLDYDQVQYLFDGPSYTMKLVDPTRGNVVARIREFVANDGEIPLFEE